MLTIRHCRSLDRGSGRTRRGCGPDRIGTDQESAEPESADTGLSTLWAEGADWADCGLSGDSGVGADCGEGVDCADWGDWAEGADWVDCTL